jgi:hypothetical protein
MTVEEARDQVVRLATKSDGELAGYWRDDLEEALNEFRDAVAARAREEGARPYREALEEIAHDHAAHCRLINGYKGRTRDAAARAVEWAQVIAREALDHGKPPRRKLPSFREYMASLEKEGGTQP